MSNHGRVISFPYVIYDPSPPSYLILWQWFSSVQWQSYIFSVCNIWPSPPSYLILICVLLSAVSFHLLSYLTDAWQQLWMIPNLPNWWLTLVTLCATCLVLGGFAFNLFENKWISETPYWPWMYESSTGWNWWLTSVTWCVLPHYPLVWLTADINTINYHW